MMNRARLIGANIFIQSQPGIGTIVTVELPLEPENLLTDYANNK
jgi:hypothetical protein